MLTQDVHKIVNEITLAILIFAIIPPSRSVFLKTDDTNNFYRTNAFHSIGIFTKSRKPNLRKWHVLIRPPLLRPIIAIFAGLEFLIFYANKPFDRVHA